MTSTSIIDLKIHSDENFSEIKKLGGWIIQQFIKLNCDRFTNFRGINPEYLYHVLSSDLIQSQIEASKTKNGQPKLALERIRNFVVPVPHQIRQEQFVGVMNSIDKYIASQQAVLDRCWPS